MTPATLVWTIVMPFSLTGCRDFVLLAFIWVGSSHVSSIHWVSVRSVGLADYDLSLYDWFVITRPVVILGFITMQESDWLCYLEGVRIRLREVFLGYLIFGSPTMIGSWHYCVRCDTLIGCPFFV